MPIKGLLLITLTLLMIMLPTSISGSLIEAPKIIIYGFAIIVVSLIPNFDKKKLVIASLCLTIMVLFTLVSNGHISGITQFIPLISFLIIISIEYNKIKISTKVLSIELTLLILIIIFLGYSVLYGNQTVTSYLIKFYTFGYEGLAKNMLSQEKPISFFISHSIAAIAYTIFFFIAVLWGKYTTKKYFYLLAILLIPLIIALKSNTSYLSLFIIYVYTFMLLNNRNKAFYLLFTTIVVYYFLSKIIDLDITLDFFLGSSNNGFLSRYDLREGVYASSIKSIIDSPFIGTGLLFDEDQYKADSGIINELLRGGIIYFLLMKYLMYLAIFKSTNEKKLSVMVVVFFMIMEIAYAFTLSLRGPTMMLLILIYLSHIYQNNTVKK